ncbi:aromatic acid exporter family protein [Gemella sp. GH3]|uniref:aromatic acid exporter family protein n=1 Tax=unclassified Gemella TaxID=2624949 RepID=UPI0015D03756|nr:MULTISPECIES: aromatic acid exporter family protein [unclassified Gemella]MBF0713566.1 aromatic acid exporter family protein [Gemella sp. GH3.1]NYS50518.1 aromatic acid exporter family protein [Gemella sp. GH3]
MDYIKFIKLAIGTMLAIILARYLHLNNAYSAGIITLISIADTRKTTLKIAYQRIISLLLVLFIGITIFYYVGYNLLSFILILIIFIPISMKFEIMIGLVPSLVLLGHIFELQKISKDIVLNEIYLMLISVIIASILNLYMPSKENEIILYKNKIENQIKTILYIFYFKLTPSEKRFSFIKEKLPKENLSYIFDSLNTDIEKMASIISVEEDNKLFKYKGYDKQYLITRMKQYNTLKYMYSSIELIKIDRKESEKLAALFYLTAEQVSEFNSCEYILKDLAVLTENYRKGELPKNRDEFEDRAILYRLLTDFKRFLEIKNTFVKLNSK